VFWKTLQSIHRGLVSLAFQEHCLNCNQEGELLCIVCRENWNCNSQYVKGEAFPVFSRVTYDELAAKVILAGKESALKSAKQLLAGALVDATLKLCNHLDISEGRIEFVPIPSTRRARMRRGEDFIYELAKLTRDKLLSAAPLIDFRITPALKVNKNIRDQSRLNETERDLNLSGAFSIDTNLQRSSRLLLFDDVITTGSTLREAYRALKERNLTVLGAVTACASKRRLLIR